MLTAGERGRGKEREDGGGGEASPVTYTLGVLRSSGAGWGEGEEGRGKRGEKRGGEGKEEKGEESWGDRETLES